MSQKAGGRVAVVQSTKQLDIARLAVRVVAVLLEGSLVE